MIIIRYYSRNVGESKCLFVDVGKYCGGCRVVGYIYFFFAVVVAVIIYFALHLFVQFKNSE